jgi:V/A-type H+/Na+-transporting ATPase subunit I
VLGVVNAALRHRGREVAGKAGLLVVLGASVVAIGWLAGYVPAIGGQVALVGLAIAIAVLVASLGIAGPIEAIGILGNVLSYARIMAIGMASVMLAITANRLGGVAGSLLAGILVAGALHAVNLVLGFVDSSIQGLRLHYVEFFGRFVEPGGTRYEPFASALVGSSASVPAEGGS